MGGLQEDSESVSTSDTDEEKGHQLPLGSTKKHRESWEHVSVVLRTSKAREGSESSAVPSDWLIRVKACHPPHMLST